MEAVVLIVYSFPIPLSDNHSIHKLPLEKTSCHHHRHHHHGQEFHHYQRGFVGKFKRDDILSQVRRIPFLGEIAREEVCGTIDLSLQTETHLEFLNGIYLKNYQKYLEFHRNISSFSEIGIAPEEECETLDICLHTEKCKKHRKSAKLP